MAAAVLQHAARRLVGVQRTVATAILEERWPLLSRLIHTDEHASISRQIQQKKEELYDLIAETENAVHTQRENRFLLRSLSAQIKPRPDDPRWCWIRTSKRRYDVLRPAGIAAGFIVSVVSFVLLSGMDDFRAQETARRKEKQQVDAAGEKEEVLGRHAPPGADACTLELELLREINQLCDESQRLQGELEEAPSLLSFGHHEEARELVGELAVNLHAMSEANNGLQKQLKAIGGKPPS